MAAGNTHILPDFVRDVALGNQLADVTMLSFRDPNSFLLATCTITLIFGDLLPHYPRTTRLRLF
jgi:hypothetical protein